LLPDLSNILDSAVILIPVIFELESPILGSHIPLWGNECGLEFQLLYLDPLSEQIMTPEPLLDLNQIPESISVLEPKSIIHHFTLHFGTRLLIKLTLKLF